MKKLLLALILPISLAFAGPYDVEEFVAQDVGTPDAYIEAEFGGELTTADPSTVTDIQEGRLFVRQKFEDPFGTEPTTYQIYQGKASANLSSLTPLTAEGVDYSKLVKAKFYERRGMDAKEDVDKVYFDGKSVFVENKTTVIAYVDGSPVVLKGTAPVTEEASADSTADSTLTTASATEDPSEYCDEYDPDCEEEDDNSLYTYDVAGDVDATNTAADNYEYSSSNAADAATARFGIGDEVRFWTAVGLSALAATGAVLGIVQHMKSNEAKDAYDEQNALIKKVKNAISDVCSTKSGADCEAALNWYIQENNISLGEDEMGTTLTYATLKSRRDTNKDTQDSYAFARNIWFGVSAASLTAAIVLFVW